MRKVKYYEYKEAETNKGFEKVMVGDAVFHQFGLDYDCQENGVGSCSQWTQTRVTLTVSGLGRA